MTLRFERREKVTHDLDPRAGLAEGEITCEVRHDPLTGRTRRAAHVAGFHLRPPDMRQLIKDSRQGSPFCPDRIFEVAPMFPRDLVPTGRIQRGDMVLVPKFAPYDEHSAVAALTREHYVPMGDFAPGTLLDALDGCREYFRAIQHHPRTDYGLLSWNFLPPSGGTQIHPHFHLFATDTPGNAPEEELSACQRYREENGSPYWADRRRSRGHAGVRRTADTNAGRPAAMTRWVPSPGGHACAEPGRRSARPPRVHAVVGGPVLPCQPRHSQSSTVHREHRPAGPAVQLDPYLTRPSNSTCSWAARRSSGPAPWAYFRTIAEHHNREAARPRSWQRRPLRPRGRADIGRAGSGHDGADAPLGLGTGSHIWNANV